MEDHRESRKPRRKLRRPFQGFSVRSAKSSPPSRSFPFDQVYLAERAMIPCPLVARQRVFQRETFLVRQERLAQAISRLSSAHPINPIPPPIDGPVYPVYSSSNTSSVLLRYYLKGRSKLQSERPPCGKDKIVLPSATLSNALFLSSTIP